MCVEDWEEIREAALVRAAEVLAAEVKTSVVVLVVTPVLIMGLPLAESAVRLEVIW